MSQHKVQLNHFKVWSAPGFGFLHNLLSRFDQLFDWLYTSRYNPFYRTGIMAILFLSFTLASGFFLLFYYSIHRPYDSMLEIEQSVYFARWIRSFHRYASDAAALFIFIHFFRMFAQGKTWGPRTLAWITGILLLLIMAVCAWTGFVLVWDEHGQKLAHVGSRVLRALPFFTEPPDRIFVGEKPLTSQFFFLNIFIHMALPLGMILFLWLHTSRLARSAWFPDRRTIIICILALLIPSVFIQAPLNSAGNLLSIPGRVPTNLFYNFWLSWADTSPASFLAVFMLVLTMLVLVPALVKPRKNKLPKTSYVDPEHCEGCQQCYNDCPFEAIEMVTGLYPDKNPLRANVLSDRCVSCGICAASCSSFAIGPEQRTAKEQLVAARALVQKLKSESKNRLIIACENNFGLWRKIKHQFSNDKEIELASVACIGSLHASVVSYMTTQAEGVLILGCPTHNCVHRDGANIADQRIMCGREPIPPRGISTNKIQTFQLGLGEWSVVTKIVDSWRLGKAVHNITVTKRLWFRGAFATLVILILLAIGSSYPQGEEIQHSMLRLGWRLPGQTLQTCRDYSEEEKSKMLAHMRKSRDCKTEVLTYLLKAVVDGRVIIETRVSPAGLRSDRPLSVEEDFKLEPGDHTVEVSFLPEKEGVSAKQLMYQGTLNFEKKKVHLITTGQDGLIAL